MKKTSIILMVAGMLGLITNAFAADMTPNQIFAKVKNTYSSMKTFRGEGIITIDSDTAEIKMKIEISFSILLKKPNLYLISWAQKCTAGQNTEIPVMSQSGAVWSDGTQPFAYMGAMNAYEKMGADELALGAATGISGDAALTIPSLFLPTISRLGDPFSHLKDPKLEKVEKVGDDDCYVISGPSSVFKKEIYWISKTKYLIRKYSRSLEPSGDTPPVTKTSDEEIEKIVKSMRQYFTDEEVKGMRERLERIRRDPKGISTEFYTTISSPKLKKADFNYALPEGTVLKEFSFDKESTGPKEPPNQSANPDKK